MHSKILQILALRKKKENELKALKPQEDEPKDIQISLAKVLKEIKDYR